MDLDLNPQFQRALSLMEKGSGHLFVTGRAGTGKSTLLQFFRSQTRKKAVFLAPTGVAAVNIGGQTIHSFFRFHPDITPAGIPVHLDRDRQGLYRRIETLVIDEVSMVRADLLDCCDAFLRRHGPREKEPFGGVQLILIGDLYQLPPVVTARERDLFRGYYDSPFFFSAKAMKEVPLDFVELEKIYRQQDAVFIGLLNAVRNRSVTDADLGVLNARHCPDFVPPAKGFYIHLTSTNDLANAVNEEKLKKLKGKTWRSAGVVDGDFTLESLPAPVDLHLKKGAQIMLLNNDFRGRWVNGTIGRVGGFTEDEAGTPLIRARLDRGDVEDIAPYTWNRYEYTLKEGELAARIVGTFTQYPVRPAFAVTIHKSQGKTFQNAVIDVGRGTFAHGQAYVALSRCATLEGIVLKRPLEKRHILMDWRVIRYLTDRGSGATARRD